MLLAYGLLLTCVVAALAHTETHAERKIGRWTLGFDATRWDRQFAIDVRICQRWDFGRLYNSSLGVSILGYGTQIRLWRLV